MAWHDKSPWAAKRDDANKAAEAKLAAVRRIIDDVSGGRLTPTKAVTAIEEAITDRIVRVGQTHTPEVQT